ncbi:hypothetical protein [Mucisphaera sp.]|uniref:hypothetical protein n=1 Tax=Mucisphaera sp. TaxID=2913024 RepID=UPI003D0A3E55
MADAIVAGDYLTYEVRPVAGFEMALQSVSYVLWRNGGNAATDYAILTSLDGFAEGAELARVDGLTASGPASAQRFTGSFETLLPGAAPVEVRLYA